MALILDGTEGVNQGNVTGASIIPVGTTAQRPANPEAGMIRFNTDEGYVEWYDEVGDNWLPTSAFSGVVAAGGTVTDITQNGTLFRVHTFTSSGTFDVARGGEVEYLVVAGGGSGGVGGATPGAGAGAGGVILGSINVTVNTHSVVVGGGGADIKISSGNQRGNDGQDSTFVGLTAVGGGAGGSVDFTANSGGSGGGSGGPGAGAGTAEQGNDGGAFGGTESCGGGGGAGQVGQDGSTGVQGGDGGDGIETIITGTSEFYGGGGGGTATSSSLGTVGEGGAGGGGRGGTGNTDAIAGAPNTGGGGGGARDHVRTGAGGSGIVIVRYRIG